MGTIANLTTIAVLYWTYSSGRLSSTVAYAVLGVCSGVPALLVVFMKRNQLMIKASHVMRDLRKDWHFGRWLFVSVIADSAGVHCVIWLVLLWHNSEVVAIMGVLIAITGLVRPIIAGVDAYLVPKLANRLKHGSLQSVAKAGAAAFAAMAGTMLVYVLSMALWGDKIVGIVYTGRYQGHATALAIVAVATALLGMNVPLRALLRVTNRPKVESFGSVLGSIAKILLGLCLIPWFGILGAAIAIGIGNLTSIVVNRLAIYRWIRDDLDSRPI